MITIIMIMIIVIPHEYDAILLMNIVTMAMFIVMINVVIIMIYCGDYNDLLW